MRLAHVAQRVGDRRHLDMAGHAVVRLCDAAVGTGHLDGAVKNVVRGDGRGNSVDGAAEGGHSVTVNGRVVNLHHTAERVIYKRDLKAALQRMLEADEPYILDIITPCNAKVLPFIKSAGTVEDMVYE